MCNLQYSANLAVDYKSLQLGRVSLSPYQLLVASIIYKLPPKSFSYFPGRIHYKNLQWFYTGTW